MRSSYGWNWEAFEGSDDCLISNFRDLDKLDLVMDLLPTKKTAVQAGGNLGLFPKRLAMEFEVVYTFEPDPSLFMKMCHNAKESNVIKLQAALGNGHRLVGTKHGSSTHTHEGVTHIVECDGSIPMLMVDDLRLDGCDLLYLDIEGYEYYALVGAAKTIQLWHPVIVCEINVCLSRVGVDPHLVRNLLRKHGYVLVFRLYTDEVYVHRSQFYPELYMRQNLTHIQGAECLL